VRRTCLMGDVLFFQWCERGDRGALARCVYEREGVGLPRHRQGRGGPAPSPQLSYCMYWHPVSSVRPMPYAFATMQFAVFTVHHKMLPRVSSAWCQTCEPLLCVGGGGDCVGQRAPFSGGGPGYWGGCQVCQASKPRVVQPAPVYCQQLPLWEGVVLGPRCLSCVWKPHWQGKPFPETLKTGVVLV